MNAALTVVIFSVFNMFLNLFRNGKGAGSQRSLVRSSAPANSTATSSSSAPQLSRSHHRHTISGNLHAFVFLYNVAFLINMHWRFIRQTITVKLLTAPGYSSVSIQLKLWTHRMMLSTLEHRLFALNFLHMLLK